MSGRTATVLFVLMAVLLTVAMETGVMVIQAVIGMFLAGQVYAGATHHR